MYSYTIVYETHRQLGFFKDHDELYFNITGNGWRLPIDHVSARVAVPDGVPIDQIQVEGYTGSQGSRGKSFSVDVTRNGIARFKSTRPFQPQEGLTVVVGWPKGIVQQPTAVQEWKWFFRDNIHVIPYVLGIIFLLCLF